jgi:predicted TPR repeat methyltransferase
MTEQFLDKVYDARDAASTRVLYDAWSASYETEVASQGYATPGRAAAALAEFAKDKSAPMLDFGCGTGLSGLAFKLHGFEFIDGVDLSADMLAQAAMKRIYRTTSQVDAAKPLAHVPGDYAAIAAIGVIGAGAAPISTFDTLMNGLAKGGLFVFSFNDHALAEPENEARVSEWTDSGYASLLFREYGDHLPGLNIKSYVYVLEKN